MEFFDLDLSDSALDAVEDMGWRECTPIQEKCIPEILSGRDIMGIAQTGTGKTAAYLLPILSLLDEGDYPEDAINCVVMSPTRELAQQIDQAMQGFSYYMPTVSSVAVYGGNDGSRYDQENRGMRLGADMIIATPGRLISHLTMGNVDFSRVSFFVLDEADRMLDMGFHEDILTITKLLPPTCQTLMFSATMPEKIESLARNILKDPVTIKLAINKPADRIRQLAYVCHENQKLAILLDIFRNFGSKRVLLFAGTKVKVREIARALLSRKVNCGEMHSDLSQAQRDDVMHRFKTGEVDILVATNIVSRGIDIDDISIVINHDVPRDCEDYVHRIGRTARADNDGIAITLVRGLEIADFMKLERFLGREVEKVPLPAGIGKGPEYRPMAVQPRGKGGHGGDLGKKKKKKGKPGGGKKEAKAGAMSPKPKADGGQAPASVAERAGGKTEKPGKRHGRKKKKKGGKGGQEGPATA